MNKFDFLKRCSEYVGLTRGEYTNYDKSVIDTYYQLIENGEITVFHGFICLVSNKIGENTYALIPYTGSYQELQSDPAFSEYHYWRAEAEKKICHKCKGIYFVSNINDSCPYC